MGRRRIRWITVLLLLVPLVGSLGWMVYAPVHQLPLPPTEDFAIRWHQDNHYLLALYGIIPLVRHAPVAKELQFIAPPAHVSDASWIPFMYEGCDWNPRADQVVLSLHSTRLAERKTGEEIFITPVAKLKLIKVVGLEFGQRNIEPSWEPTGERIAFLSAQDVIKWPVRLCAVRPDGSHLKVLVAGNVYTQRLLWSPKGHKLLATFSILKPSGQLSKHKTAVVDADTGQIQPVVLPGLYGYDATHACWSPDGQEIAFRAGPNLGMVSGLYLWHLKDHSVSILVPARNYRYYTCCYPVWSPDGKHIAYLGGRDDYFGGKILYVLDIKTKQVRILHEVKSTMLAPSWSPDGRSLATMQEAPGPILKITLDAKPHVSTLAVPH